MISDQAQETTNTLNQLPARDIFFLRPKLDIFQHVIVIQALILIISSLGSDQSRLLSTAFRSAVSSYRPDNSDFNAVPRRRIPSTITSGDA